jgi:hypothetical protein
LECQLKWHRWNACYEPPMTLELEYYVAGAAGMESQEGTLTVSAEME